MPVRASPTPLVSRRIGSAAPDVRDRLLWPQGLGMIGRSISSQVRPLAGVGNLMLTLRLATPADTPRLRDLIEQSVRALSVGYYTGPQIESTLRHIFGQDTQLIADRTYYVIESEAGELVAAGGWGRRRTLYGDQMKGAEGPLLDPASDPARVRAFFVHPSWVRRGLGRRLFDRCAADAAGAGFGALELMASLPGEPFYRALG